MSRANHQIKAAIRSTMLSCLMLCLLAVSPVSGARISLTLFPLKNARNDTVSQWISYSVPESFFRVLRYVNNIPVWSPTFLFPIDTTGWSLGSDSLLKIHQRRWKWDAAVGGEFYLQNDSVHITLKTLWLRDGVAERKKFDEQGTNVPQVVERLFFKFMKYTGFAFAGEDSIRFSETLIKASKSLPAYQTYWAGYGFEMQNDRAAAISAYLQAVELDNNFSAAWLRIGRLYADRRNYDMARAAFDKAEYAGFSDPIVAAQKADFIIDYDLPDKAVKYVDARKSVLSQTARGLKVLGKSLVLQGEYQRAIAILTKALSMGASDLETEFVLSKAYMMSGQFDLSADVLNRLIAFRPDYLAYYSFLGNAYRSAGKQMESIRVLEAASKIAPNDIGILLNLAHTYFDLGWFQKAEQLLLRARDRNANLIEIDVNLAVVYWMEGKASQARALLNTVIRKRKNHQSAINNEANILFLSNDIRKAITLYRKADQASKKNESVLFNLGTAYLKLGKIKDAQQTFDELLRLSPDRMDVLTRQAIIARTLGDSVNAVIYYRKILEVTPFQEEAIRGLVLVLNGQGKYDESADILDRYIENFPSAKEFLYLQAETYRLMGWVDVAVMKYGEMVKNFPAFSDAFRGQARATYDLVAQGKHPDLDNAIYTLKKDIDQVPADPEPEYLLGMVYADFKGYPDMGVEHLNSALAKAKDTNMKKKIREAISKVKK
jgi:tetratricopeptide (TPR) repeat protein